MQTFNAITYVMIDIANQYGLDKLTWEERINWTKTHMDSLEQYADEAEHPLLYKKAIRALDDAVFKQPSGHLVSMDATASGLQILSAITGCRSGCILTNLIDSGERQDVYDNIAQDMGVTREKVKKP